MLLFCPVSFDLDAASEMLVSPVVKSREIGINASDAAFVAAAAASETGVGSGTGAGSATLVSTTSVSTGAGSLTLVSHFCGGLLP